MADGSNFLPEDQFPDDLDPSSTLEVLDERLLDPTIAPPDLVVTDAEPAPLGRSWAYDFSHKRFLQRPGGTVQTRGITTLRQWIEKCLRTDRGAHPIHPDDYGMERPFDLIGQGLASASKDDLQARIEDALTFHPQIVGVQDMDLTYDPDDPSLNVSFTVVLRDDQQIAVTDLSLP